MFAIRTFPGAGHGKHIGIVFFRNGAQGGVGRKACIGHHGNLADPGWGDKVLQHLPKQNILRPRSWRRPPQLPLGEAKAPQPRRHEAFKDSDRHTAWPQVADTVIEAYFDAL